MWYAPSVKTGAELFKALADDTRLRILRCLAGCEACRCRDVCVCELCDCLGVKSSTLSSHLNVLRQAGLVTVRKEGTWVYYRLAKGLPEFVLEAIGAISAQQTDLKRLRSRLRLRVDGRCCVPLGALQKNTGGKKND
ncbi:MAG: winged helix-turn-helix transcriptional regulator [Armatimonadetes bacterium]|nr:winged helix-turn-helix transcriptional regulator [Armatimonadota bacterium]